MNLHQAEFIALELVAFAGAAWAIVAVAIQHSKHSNDEDE